MPRQSGKGVRWMDRFKSKRCRRDVSPAFGKWYAVSCVLQWHIIFYLQPFVAFLMRLRFQYKVKDSAQAVARARCAFSRPSRTCPRGLIPEPPSDRVCLRSKHPPTRPSVPT